MLKPIFKEIILLVLIGIAILLVLAIVFYDYIPIDVTLPTQEAYETPEEVQNEITDLTTEASRTEVTYEITDSDLNIYLQRGNYTEGKADPFALEDESTIESTNTTASGSSVTGTNSLSTNTTTSTTTSSSSSTTTSSSSSSSSSSTTSTNSTSSTSSSSSSSNSSSSNSSSTETFFEDKGIK